jgi:hypothetical protein
MHISSEGKIGILLALIGLAGAGAIMVAPQATLIGWSLIAFAVLGLLALALHHFDIEEYRFKIRRGKMLPLIGMIASGIAFISCSTWYFWPSFAATNSFM